MSMGRGIMGENWSIDHDEETGMVALKGTLRLNGLEEYRPIAELLSRQAAERNQVVINLRELEFLNSSGIAMLSKFVIEARNRQTVAVTILGAQRISWQSKSLVNLQRLMPALTLEII